MISQTVTILATGETFTSTSVDAVAKFIQEKTKQDNPRSEYVKEGNKLVFYLNEETDVPFASVV